MTPIAIGFLGLGGLLVLLAVRVPIGAALGTVAFLGILVLRGPQAAMVLLSEGAFDFVAHWSLSAVPMFILMGSIAFHSGLTSTLFAAARAWFGFMPGGLAVATTCASAGFAAASGSSVAMAGAMSRLAVPEMLKAGYDKGLAAGVVAASGTLGALIPPSIPFILYGVFMEASVSKLLIAGIVPGLLTFLAYTALIVIRAKLNPALAPRSPERFTLRQKCGTLVAAWPLPVIVLGVIGGLYSGVFTATEVGAFGACVTLFAALVSGRFSAAMLYSALREALLSTAAIFLIAIGAVLFSQFLTLTRIPLEIGRIIDMFAVNQLVFILLVSLFYLVLGMFLDPIGLMLVTLPLLSPAITALDVDVIWFGVLVVKFVEIGLLTPPIGLNLYVVAAALNGKVSFAEITRGTAWFLAAEAVVMVIVIACPGLILLLPNIMQ